MKVIKYLRIDMENMVMGFGMLLHILENNCLVFNSQENMRAVWQLKERGIYCRLRFSLKHWQTLGTWKYVFIMLLSGSLGGQWEEIIQENLLKRFVEPFYLGILLLWIWVNQEKNLSFKEKCRQVNESNNNTNIWKIKGNIMQMR